MSWTNHWQQVESSSTSIWTTLWDWNSNWLCIHCCLSLPRMHTWRRRDPEGTWPSSRASVTPQKALTAWRPWRLPLRLPMHRWGLGSSQIPLFSVHSLLKLLVTVSLVCVPGPWTSQSACQQQHGQHPNPSAEQEASGGGAPRRLQKGGAQEGQMSLHRHSGRGKESSGQWKLKDCQTVVTVKTEHSWRLEKYYFTQLRVLTFQLMI